MRTEAQHKELGRMMLRQLEAERNLADAIAWERHLYCLGRVSEHFGICLGAAELFVEMTDNSAMELFHVGNDLDRRLLH